jgi:hypothetical protein
VLHKSINITTRNLYCKAAIDNSPERSGKQQVIYTAEQQLFTRVKEVENDE